MITAIVSFSPVHLASSTRHDEIGRIEDLIGDVPKLSILRRFRSGKVAKVSANLNSIKELQVLLGQDYVVEADTTMEPL